MNKIFKKRAHITALTVGLLCPVGCSGDIQGSNLELYNVNVAQSSESSFKKIDWILSKNGTQIIRGINPNPNPSYNSLENLVFTDIDPHSFDITPWDITVMAKFVPLKRLIEKHADHYSIDPMWASQFFNLESLMIPTDHNTLSDDFGLGQIKRNSERLAKRLGTDPTNVLYSPDLDTNGNIFDPETNIIMAMLLHRYNIKKHGLKNSNQVYAVYFRGKPGLKPNGIISKIAKDNVDGLRERFELYRKVIPLFRLREGEIRQLKNKDAKVLLEIYNSTSNPREMYAKELDYFLSDIEDNLTGDIRTVLIFDDSVSFASTLEISYGINQADTYKRLEAVGNKLKNIVEGDDLIRRINSTNERLQSVIR